VKKSEGKKITPVCIPVHARENQPIRHSVDIFQILQRGDLFLSCAGKRRTMESIVGTLLAFVIALIISTLIIYVIVTFFGEKEGISTALIAALIGTIAYTIIYYWLGQGLLAAFIAGIVWLLALQMLYSIGWIKSLVIAVVIWVVASIVGWILPTLTGPL
jgi:hypothetical protein